MDMRCPIVLALLSSLAACGGSSNSSSMSSTPMGEVVAGADAYTVYVDPSGLSNSDLLDVLANDTSSSGGTLSLVGVTGPAHGSAVVQAVCGVQEAVLGVPPPRPCIAYLSTPGFIGVDQFTYTVQDSNGHTATGQITVTIMDHFVLQGRVLAPAGSISATQVGLLGHDERTPIATDGTFALSLPVGTTDQTLIADAPNADPSFVARLGATGSRLPDLSGNGPVEPVELRLNGFSTALYAVMTEPGDPSLPAYFEGEALDWPDILDRATLIQLALEAGGVSAALPSPLVIATDADVRAQLRARFGDAAIAQREQALLDDADQLPLMTSPPQQVIAYAQDLGAWGDVVLVRLTGAGTGSYVTAYGGGTAGWQTADGLTTVTPTSGPADIGPFAFRLIGIDGDISFGVSLRSNGRLGTQLWNGEQAPQLFVSSNPAGLQDASFSVVSRYAVNGTVHQVPVCFLPAGADAPFSYTLGFHQDTTGIILGSAAPFEWLQSSVLSVRYGDGSVATYITTARFVDNSLRVIADETFPSGDEVLCAGRDVQQF